jgi:hypothetical protein
MPVQIVISQVGPLPISQTFNAMSDAPAVLVVSGSVWSQQANTMLQIAIQIDKKQIGTAQVYSNGPSTHRTVVTSYIPVQLTQGQHSLSLALGNSATTSDQNDFFTAVILY